MIAAVVAAGLAIAVAAVAGGVGAAAAETGATRSRKTVLTRPLATAPGVFHYGAGMSLRQGSFADMMSAV